MITIKMIKGVADVQPKIAKVELYFSVEKARRELVEKLWNVLNPK